MEQESPPGPAGHDVFARVTDRASIYEVSPRDGLQNEAAFIPLEGKRRLIEALCAAGLTRIEITSFVSPKWVPQLGDAEELARTMKPPAGVTFSALVPNARGLINVLRFEGAKYNIRLNAISPSAYTRMTEIGRAHV